MAFWAILEQFQWVLVMYNVFIYYSFYYIKSYNLLMKGAKAWLKLTGITLKCPSSPSLPHPPQKVRHTFINYCYFWFSYMYCDFCAWAICQSKKVYIQIEGTFTEYQSFRTVLKTIYHLLLTIFNWDQFRRWGFLQFDTHISNTNTAICFNKQWHFLCSNKINEKWLPTNMYHQYYFF